MTDFSRRDFLKATAAVGATATAGCLGVLEGESGVEQTPDGLPEYVNWIPAENVGLGTAATFVHIDWPWFVEHENTGTDPYAAVDTEHGTDNLRKADPLFGLPVAGYTAATLSLSFALQPYEFVVDIVRNGGDEVGVTDILSLGDVYVLRGVFDREQVSEKAEGYEQVEQRNGFDIYEATQSDDDMTTPALAASEDGIALVLQSKELEDGVGELEKVVDAVGGDADTLADANSAAETAFRRSGYGRIAYGIWGADGSAFDALSNSEKEDSEPFLEFDSSSDPVNSFVSGLAIDNEEGVATGRLSLMTSGGAPDESEVKEKVGYTVTTREIQMGESRADIAGTWREE